MNLTQNLQTELERKSLLCPYCQGELSCFWGRNGGRWNVHHPIKHCPLRFHDFGFGQTEEEAWQQAKTFIKSLTHTNS